MRRCVVIQDDCTCGGCCFSVSSDSDVHSGSDSSSDSDSGIEGDKPWWTELNKFLVFYDYVLSKHGYPARIRKLRRELRAGKLGDKPSKEVCYAVLNAVYEDRSDIVEPFLAGTMQQHRKQEAKLRSLVNALLESIAEKEEESKKEGGTA